MLGLGKIFLIIAALNLLAETKTPIALFIKKNSSTEDTRQALEAAEITALLHCPSNMSVFFLDPQEVITSPEKFVPFLTLCPFWLGPVLTTDALNIKKALEPHIKEWPKHFYAFSNNQDLLEEGITPFGPSPLQEVPVLMEHIANRGLHTLLVLAPRKWSRHMTQSLVQSASNLTVTFFFYDTPIAPTTLDDLTKALLRISPDALFAPFGDITTLEVLSTAMHFITEKAGLRPFVLGTSSWTHAFRTDISLIGATLTTLPVSNKGKVFASHFKKVYDHAPSRLAFTVHDLLLLAFNNTLEDSNQDIDVCLGKLSINSKGVFYHPRIKKLA